MEMGFWSGLGIGLFVGVLIGVFIMCLVLINGRPGRRVDDPDTSGFGWVGDEPETEAHVHVMGGRGTVTEIALQRLASVPMRTGRGGNDREHPMARHRRVKAEKKNVGWMLAVRPRPAVPCVIVLTRVAPSTGLDDDNLAGSLKGARDAVADWLGVDDRHSDIVRYRYQQRRGPWGVEISVEAT